MSKTIDPNHLQKITLPYLDDEAGYAYFVISIPISKRDKARLLRIFAGFIDLAIERWDWLDVLDEAATSPPLEQNSTSD